jgi:hypothetical protein
MQVVRSTEEDGRIASEFLQVVLELAEVSLDAGS